MEFSFDIQVIGPAGLLRHKTRVLVTHGVSFLPLVDEILVMKDGSISERGSYQQLLGRKGPFSEFLLEHMGDNQGEESSEELEGVKGQLEQLYGEKGLRKRLESNRSPAQSSCLTVVGKPGAKEVQGQEVAPSLVAEGEMGGQLGGRLIHTEDMQTGGVKSGVYRSVVGSTVE